MARNVEFDEETAVRKAMDVFWEKGYKGTSLRDLTEAMKINSSSLYNTIGDKQVLFVRCVKMYTDLRKKDLDERMKSGKSPLTTLVNFINDSVKVIIEDDNGCMAVKAAFEMDSTDKQLKDILQADSQSTYKFLTRLIKKAIEQGEMSADEDPELLADYFLSMWTGWNESFILHKDAAKIRKMAQYFIKQLSR